MMLLLLTGWLLRYEPCWTESRIWSHKSSQVKSPISAKESPKTVISLADLLSLPHQWNVHTQEFVPAGFGAEGTLQGEADDQTLGQEAVANKHKEQDQAQKEKEAEEKAWSEKREPDENVQLAIWCCMAWALDAHKKKLADDETRKTKEAEDEAQKKEDAEKIQIVAAKLRKEEETQRKLAEAEEEAATAAKRKREDEEQTRKSENSSDSIEVPVQKHDQVPLSAPSDYQLFVSDFVRLHEPNYINESGKLEIGKLACEVSKVWSRLPDHDRNNWETLAENLRQNWPITRHEWTREGSIYRHLS